MSVVVETGLRDIGWRVDRIGLGKAVWLFQAGYSLDGHIKVDGIIGPQTEAAMKKSLAAGMKCSPHFYWTEFVCKCEGKYEDCERIWISRWLIDGLERYRAAFSPDGLKILSGCRCPRHNKAQGGAPESMHLRGMAADLPPVASLKQARELNIFGGLGYGRITRKIRHVDTRLVPASFTDGW